MSFLDLYQGDQDQAARMQPNEGTRLPSGFGENLHAAWSDGQLFSQSIARSNARSAVLGDYIDEIRQKTGNDLSKEFIPDVAGGGQTGVTDFDTANARVAKLKESYPELDLAPLSEDEIDKRAVAKSQAAHRTYQDLQAGEKTTGGSVGSFLGSAGSAAADPINVLALAVAPETGGASILSAALRWGALAGVSQAAIEAASDTFKEQVQPGYTESGAPLHEIGGAFLGGAVLGGGFKALGNAWTRVKTGQWPTSVRDAGNVIESEANVADTNIFPGVAGEVAHREALVKTIDDILAGRPVDVGQQITPELTQAAAEAERAKIVPAPPSGLPPKQLALPLEGGTEPPSTAAEVAKGLTYNRARELAQQAKAQADSEVVDIFQGDKAKATEYNKQLGRAMSENDATSIDARQKLEVLTSDLTPEQLIALEREPPEEQTESWWLKVADTINQHTSTDTSMLARNLAHALQDTPTHSDWARMTSREKLAVVAANKVVSDAAALGVSMEDVLKKVPARVRERFGDSVDADFMLQTIKDSLDAQKTPQPRKATTGQQPLLQGPDEMAKTLTAPDHQDAIRADIDRERAMGDVQVPGIDEQGNHAMVSVDKAMDEVDAYKKLADDIQACAAPAQEAAE